MRKIIFHVFIVMLYKNSKVKGVNIIYLKSNSADTKMRKSNKLNTQINYQTNIYFRLRYLTHIEMSHMYNTS